MHATKYFKMQSIPSEVERQFQHNVLATDTQFQQNPAFIILRIIKGNFRKEELRIDGRWGFQESLCSSGRRIVCIALYRLLKAIETTQLDNIKMHLQKCERLISKRHL